MKIIIDSPEKLNLAIKDLKQLYDKNGQVNYSASKPSAPKTKKQLGFIWEIFTDVLTPEFNKLGYKWTPEDVKQYFYTELAVNEPIETMTGRLIYRHKGMSQMDVPAMIEFINQVIDYVDEMTDFILPSWVRYTWINNLTEQDIEALQSIKWKDEDKRYLNYIKTQSCLICGQVGCDVHHAKNKSTSVSEKTPDWMAVPICHKCHIKQEGHITTHEIIEKTKNVLQGLDITLFCKLCYARWYYHQ